MTALYRSVIGVAWKDFSLSNGNKDAEIAHLEKFPQRILYEREWYFSGNGG